MNLPMANLQRFFAEVVSVDAWHKPFDGQTLDVALHADVVFREARLGAEPNCPVRFRLGIRKAEVVLRIPVTEPVEALPNSVSRDDPLAHGRLTITVGNTSTRTSGAKAAIGTRPSQSNALLEASGASTRSNERSLEIDRPSTGASVLQSKTATGDYRWELTPLTGQTLDGRGWDALSEPRVTLRDLRTTTKSLPPSVRFEVFCAKEDLSVTDVTLKDVTLMEALSSSFGFDNRRAAAEAYIRTRLVEAGLEVGSFDDPFEQICIADVMARAIK